MKAYQKALFTGLLPIAALVFAHVRHVLQVEETVMINAEADTSWNMVKDFDSLHTMAHPAIISTAATSGK